jgi:hypothetical protein
VGKRSRWWRRERRTSGAGERQASVDDIPIRPVNTTEGPQRRLFLWLGSAGAVIATALLPGWANLMWKFGGDRYDDLAVRTRVNSIKLTIPVSKQFHDSLYYIADFHCLIIRYGTDEALRDRAMPTERDKADGQRQLTSVPVSLSLQAENGLYHLSFKLKVHAYLGTQFKLYATAKNPNNNPAIQKVEKALKKVNDKGGDCSDKFDVDTSDNKPAEIMCVKRGGTLNERVFFLVDKYNPTLSAGVTIINNFVSPGGT